MVHGRLHKILPSIAHRILLLSGGKNKNTVALTRRPKWCWGPSMKVRWAYEKDMDAVKRLADDNRNALGFVVRTSLEEQACRRELLIAEQQGRVIGFVSLHHRRDGWTTIHELCVTEGSRRRGMGRALVEAVEDDALRANQNGIRLKCPLDLPTNGFYRDYPNPPAPQQSWWSGGINWVHQ